MPKLPVLTSRQLIKILESRGFVKKRSSGSHIIFHHPSLKKQAIVPFHCRDLPKGTISSILKSIGIDRGKI
ncbi:type II toxin-antitoxin system HicA family toxin [Patescibacteria group bacterium]|nr:type II toxin-antitoxin system HicA family toxin [Patescibacteria group bacterium]